MKGDFTRDTFDPARHFSRVLMQQGRVQLDADWNEQSSILLHYLQTLAADLIGPSAGPAAALGFEIKPDGKVFSIGAGRYYVDGILCENESTCDFTAQPDYPYKDKAIDYKNYSTQSGNFAVVLDVWERHLTFLDDNLIREVALGGPDTATRAKLVWQVRLLPADSCDEITKRLLEISSKLGKELMQARLKPEAIDPDPCITSPDSLYRGAENQLYRVEIHKSSIDLNGNSQPWSFKWSRENGSIVASWLDTNEDGGLVVSSARGFEAGKWVELTSSSDELTNQPGTFSRVSKVEGGALFLDPAPTWDKNTLQKIRQWDQSAVGDTVLKDGAVVGVEDQWFDLEDGIQVRFEPKHDYFSGDYWLIPARVATGQIEWPQDASGDPALLGPRGIRHHFAPLAMLAWDGRSLRELDNGDCRCIIPELRDCQRIGRADGGPKPSPAPAPAPKPVVKSASTSTRKKPSG